MSPQELLDKAQALRDEIEASRAASRKFSNAKGVEDESSPVSTNTSPWSLPRKEHQSDAPPAYRFYVNIGREEGTWMEPRWGASGNRIEFTLDVAFTTLPVTRQVAEQMVQDNRGASSSQVFCLDTAPFARLRGGFDRMKCEPGGFRIDTNKQGQKTLRLFFHTEGKTSGDVSVPQDSNLYVSLPVLADSSLSRRDGIVSVRQYGWNTGWFSSESRIVGVVKARPMAEARAKDGF